MAQIPIPATIQGRDLSPLMRDTSTDWRKDFLFEHLFEHPRIPKSEGVVSLSEKYFVYPEQEPPHEEYYNLIDDPHETQNRIAEETLQERVELQRERLKELVEELGAAR